MAVEKQRSFTVMNFAIVFSSAFVLFADANICSRVKSSEISDNLVEKPQSNATFIPKPPTKISNVAPTLNIYQLVLKLNLTLFANALVKSGLHKILDHEGPFTVFAPVNEAFINAPKYCQNVPLENRMKYHVTRGRNPSNVLINDLELWTLLSKRYVRINVYKNTNKMTASGRQIIQPDNIAINGVIHVIKDEMCAIYKGGAMFEINRCPSFQNATYAVNVTGLFDAIDSVDPITVFVPSDASIQSLPNGIKYRLKSDKVYLKKVVLNHIVPKTIYIAGMFQGQVLKTASGKKIYLSVKNGFVTINGHSKIILSDATVKNGVVHAVDQVILPDDNRNFVLKNNTL